MTCALVTDSWGPLSKANFTLPIVQVRNRLREIRSFAQTLQARKQQCLDANIVWAWFALASLCQASALTLIRHKTRESSSIVQL